MEWQPIETAPKDGTRVLVWRKLPNAGKRPVNPSIAKWTGHHWRVQRSSKNPDCCTEEFIEAWQPLPAPPVTP